MKVSCEVIQDLLPLYHDGVCSKESTQIVDKHLETCEICRKMLADMDADIMPGMAEDLKPLISVQINWNREKRKVFIKGLAIAVCVFLFLSFANHALTEWKCVPMDKDDLVLMEVFQTSDGWIRFGYNDLYDLNYYSSSILLGEDGNGYVECYRPVLAKKEKDTPQYASAGIGFTLEENCFDKDGNLVTVDRVYLGVLDQPERSILVWEAGMDVRPATQEEEERYSWTHDPS